MKKKGRIPITRVKNPEPDVTDPDWVIWAAWADRITFEEIEKKTGKNRIRSNQNYEKIYKTNIFQIMEKRVNQKV